MTYHQFRQPHRYKKESRFWKIAKEYSVPVAFGIMGGIVFGMLYIMGKMRGAY